MGLTLIRTHILDQGQSTDSSANVLSISDYDTSDRLCTISGLDTNLYFYINKATTTDRSSDAPQPPPSYYGNCLGLGEALQAYYYHYDEYGTLHLDGPWRSGICDTSGGGVPGGGFYRLYSFFNGIQASYYVDFFTVGYYLVRQGLTLIPYRCFFYGTHSFISQVSDHEVALDYYLEVKEELETSIATPYGAGYLPDSWLQCIPDYSTLDYAITIEDHSTDTSFQQFLFLVEAIPQPYSVRIRPDTNIWLRLRDPDYPLNPDTLVFRVNDIDVSSQVIITPVTNGMELLYNPIINFQNESRVSVHLSMSSDHVNTTTFSGATTSGYDYISITDSTSLLQPDYVLHLGPNSLGQSESSYVIDTLGAHTIQVPPLTYMYQKDDIITYYSPDTNMYEISYWFDIIPDYRPPWIAYIYPEAESINLDTMTYISFHIYDLGLGVDISTLIFRINHIDVYPEITKYADDHYYIYYQPQKAFYFNSYVHCFVQVYDLSGARNYTVEFWRFKTCGPNTPLIQGFDPVECEYDVPRFSDVQVDVYGRDSGLDLANLLLTIDGAEYEYEMWPELYRPEEDED